MQHYWLWNYWKWALLGAISGSAISVATLLASQLDRRGTVILCGTLAGIVAAVVLRRYRGTVQLTGATVSVPYFSRLEFTVTKDSRHVAWQIFIEAVTRISSQPLTSSTGLLREAMTSLYGLFAITREILKNSQPSQNIGNGPTVEHLAIAMLNVEIRPFLSRWHPSLRTWEAANPDGLEADWPANAECRADLIAMQKRLIEYVLSFGRLAGIPNSRQIVEGTLGPKFTAATSAAFHG